MSHINEISNISRQTTHDFKDGFHFYHFILLYNSITEVWEPAEKHTNTD